MLRASLLLGLSLLIGACASNPQRQERLFDIYDRHAGPETTQVRYSNLRGWRPIDNDALALDVGGNRHYLVEVTSECSWALRNAVRIGVRSEVRNTLTRFDRIIVDREVCRITRIRPYDLAAVEAELAARRRQLDSQRTEIDLGELEPGSEVPY